jgi:hypothetical protein
MAKQTIERKTVDTVFILLGSVAAVVLLTASTLGFWGYRFATGMVRTELSAQKIYFPEKGSPAFDPKEFPDIQQYAGQLVDTGPEARAYADSFIARHLDRVAGGKAYSEVSSLAMQNPTNQSLQAQKATLFQGEMLRGALLGNGYAYWTFGMMAFYAAITAFAGAVVMAALVLMGLRHMRKLH